MPDIISVIIALVLVIVAAVHDLREFRIPNRLIVAGIVVGVSVIVIRGEHDGIPYNSLHGGGGKCRICCDS